MEKKIISLLLLSCIALTGCVSKAEFNALEERVSYLESKSGIKLQDQSDRSSNNSTESSNEEKDVISYIKNWDEVLTIIEQAFGRKDYTITQVFVEYGQEGQFYNFGNGLVFVTANDVGFTLHIKDFIVQSVIYTDGQEYYTINTPSYNASSQ